MQIGSLMFMIAIPLLNRKGIHFLLGSYYSLSVGQWTIIDPALALQTFLLTAEIGAGLILAVAVPTVVAFLFGKVFCSWACPFFLLAEWGKGVRHRLISRSTPGLNRNSGRFLFWGIFAGFLILTGILGFPLITFLSMPGLLSAEIGDWLFPGPPGWEILLVGIILLLEIGLAGRIWCRYVCPVGATLALFRTGRTLRVKFSPEACSCPGEGLPCNMACPLGLNPKAAGIYPFCNNCGECVETCKRFGQALQLTWGGQGNNSQR